MASKIAETYFEQLCNLKEEDYPLDTRQIENRTKIADLYYDIVVNDFPDFAELSEDMKQAAINLSNSREVRAFKMGLAHGMAVVGVTA